MKTDTGFVGKKKAGEMYFFIKQINNVLYSKIGTNSFASGFMVLRLAVES